MRNQLKMRLKELESEYAAGQRLLADLRTKEKNLRATLLRLSGAIQVLKEELAKEKEAEATEKIETNEVIP